MRIAAVALGAVALVMVTATACDDGPECLDSHTVTNFVPIYNATTKTTTVQPVITVVCDRYETGESK